MDSRELKTQFDVGNGITLRAWTEADIPIAYDIVMRERDQLRTFMRWMTDDYSFQDSEKFISAAIEKRKERNNLGLGVFRGDELIGSIGFVHFDWESRTTEIGYWIAKSEEGKGIVTAATKRLIEYTFYELNFNRIEIRCSVENKRSAAVPIRLGFQLEGTLRQAEIIHDRLHDFHIYALLAEDARLW
jgi:ribosomal-protein-serine acetyltransferase